MLRGVLSAVLAALLLAAPAAAHDSLTPRGADHRWLPAERWVEKHWMPFDEADLYRELRVDTAAVFAWLYDDHRTLAQLARRRGVDPSALVKRLMEPRRSSLSANEYRVLRARTKRMLTQGHLAQHVLFHIFHGAHLDHVEHLFGVSLRVYRRLRDRERLSRYEIAERGGRTRESVRQHVVADLEQAAGIGVRIGATTQAQADRMLARQLRTVDCWLGRPAPKFDPWNPFGDRYAGHGPHRRGSRVGIRNPKPPRGCWKALTEPFAPGAG
jgi:hypothetical protein